MQLGPMRLRPRFGNVFAPSDALMVVATLHGAKLDAATGKAGLRSRFSILKDGKPVARGAEDAFTTPDAVASVGPIPLATYAPGAYVVRLDVTDAVANQTLRQEVPFEIRAVGTGGGAAMRPRGRVTRRSSRRSRSSTGRSPSSRSSRRSGSASA